MGRGGGSVRPHISKPFICGDVSRTRVHALARTSRWQFLSLNLLAASPPPSDSLSHMGGNSITHVMHER
eukprot:360598-Chlamydomonas_euryale.AAC.8